MLCDGLAGVGDRMSNLDVDCETDSTVACLLFLGLFTIVGGRIDWSSSISSPSHFERFRDGEFGNMREVFNEEPV